MTGDQGDFARENPDPVHENPYAASQIAGQLDEDQAPGGEPLNPWLSIWTRPRATMRQILDTNPTRYVLLLAALGGISQALDRASMRSAGDELPLAAILGIAVVFGPLGGIIGLYLGGALIGLTGRWLGGVGQSVHVRAALAWAQVPAIWALSLWVPNLALFGSDMFTTETPRVDADNTMLIVFVGLGVIEVIIGVWQVVVMLKCIREAHRFSAWKALGAFLLAAFMILGVVLVPLLLIVLATSMA